ncbi:hypothetical protein P5704_026755 (plasmid) [Pseudomonas sp. FeN3W]|nr:hypothetical protein P5704_026755 [Pseudomonas sp. FeN3W]
MFVYVILFIVLVLSWPAFSLLFDGLKWLYNRLSGKRLSRKSTHSSITEEMEDEGYTPMVSSIDDMRIEDDFRMDAGDDNRFL